MPPIVRFAPSPTGRLHLGNARTAVINWLFARHGAGRFVLRIDDTDRARSSEAFVEDIRRDLQWLGLGWDGEARQSARHDLYAATFERLCRSGRVYPAYETEEELATMRARRRAKGLPPRYDRAALRLSEADRRRLEGEGRVPHWRFRLPDGPVAFDDLVRGPQSVDLRHLSDPVMRREDGGFTYLFASIADDLELEITHVIRGEDHLTNTGIQTAMARALDASPPAFGHLPLVLDAEGGKVSKRLGSITLQSLREAGIEPRAVVLLLASLGTGRAPEPTAPLDELVSTFDLAAFGRAQPRLDPSDLERVSRAVLRGTSLAEVESRLLALGIAAPSEAFWEAVRPNIGTLAEAADWWRILHEPRAPVIEDAAFCSLAADALEQAPPGQPWINELGASTGRKGRALYRPLRLALTGREHGPPLPDLVALLGRKRAVRRLRGETC